MSKEPGDWYGVDSIAQTIGAIFKDESIKVDCHKVF